MACNIIIINTSKIYKKSNMSDKPKKDKKDKKKVDPKYDYDIYMNQIKEGKFIAIGGHH